MSLSNKIAISQFDYLRGYDYYGLTAVNGDDKNSSIFQENDVIHGIFDPNEISIKLYEEQLPNATSAFPNVTTAANFHALFSGFCNQNLRFQGMVHMAMKGNYSQIILESLSWKDQFGFPPMYLRWKMEYIFDIVHWNSFYPTLPRLVKHNASFHPHGSVRPQGEYAVRYVLDENSPMTNPSKLYHREAEPWLERKRIMKDRPFNTEIEKAADIAIFRGALRPHPILQQVIHNYRHIAFQSSKYMVIHARIEPDMNEQQTCRNVKETNLTNIISHIYEKFPSPPLNVTHAIVMLDRKMLQEYVSNKGIKEPSEMDVYNLNVLNDIDENGLWDGKVKVHEAGTKLASGIDHPLYSRIIRLVGGLMNFYLSLDSTLFVGTEVSTFSMSIVESRFFRSSMNNYLYQPDGIYIATSASDSRPPVFRC